MAFGFQTKKFPSSSRFGKKEEEARDQRGTKRDQKASSLPFRIAFYHASMTPSPSAFRRRRMMLLLLPPPYRPSTAHHRRRWI
jgi:hypothetical protein